MSGRANIISKYAKRTVFNNRGRAILTLIGIIVATTMFTLVSSAYVSAMDILKSFADDDYGQWHVQAYSISSIDYQKMAKDSRVEEVAYVQELGCNPGPGGMELVSHTKKYKYFVGAMNPEFQELCNYHLVQGRLPENENEAIISLEMFADDRNELSIGAQISLDMYTRYSEGHKVVNLESLVCDRSGLIDEEVFLTGSSTFTIVGYFVVPEYASWKNIADNTILTTSDSIITGNTVNAYYQLKDASLYRSFTKSYFEDEDSCLYNKDFIRLEDSADDSHTKMTFAVIMAFTVAIIVLLAVMLIYNSFSTSSSERLRAICLLKSVGATRKQVRQLILKEAFYYSIIAIPIGVALGQFLSACLIHALQDMSSDAANFIIAKNIDLEYRLGYQNLIAPVLLAIFTILIAVFVPMMKVSRVTPVKAVRDSEIFDEKRRSNVFGHFNAKITERIFGFAGGLSMKNYLRYRKRYRATVISIVASVLMIIFANMLVRNVSNMLFDTEQSGQADVIHYIQTTDVGGFGKEDRSLFYEMAAVEGVRSSRMSFTMEMYISLPQEETTESYQVLFPDMVEEETVGSQVQMVFVEDGTWRELCEKYGIDSEEFLTYGSRKCLINNQCTYFDEATQQIQVLPVFEQLPERMDFPYLITEYGYSRTELLERMHLEPVAEVDWVEELASDLSCIQIYVPMSRMEYYELEGNIGVETFQFTAKDPRTAVEAMKEILEEHLYMTDPLVDLGRETRAARAVNKLMEIILYGYVAMLSLMCFLNVVMTVISNIMFRRKEYILLMAVGMSRKTLFRMVIAESLIYFSEGVQLLILLFGGALLLSMLLIDPSIYRYIRVLFAVIVVLMHLLVVVVTTGICLSSFMKDDIIEGLRKEYY